VFLDNNVFNQSADLMHIFNLVQTCIKSIDFAALFQERAASDETKSKG